MTTYFKVNSNVKHNGTQYNAGDVVQGELPAFQGLVNDGLFAVVQAESLEQAKDLSSQETGTIETAPEKEPVNTWGPKPDEEEKIEENKNEIKTGGEVETPKEEIKEDSVPSLDDGDGQNL